MLDIVTPPTFRSEIIWRPDLDGLGCFPIVPRKGQSHSLRTVSATLSSHLKPYCTGSLLSLTQSERRSNHPHRLLRGSGQYYGVTSHHKIAKGRGVWILTLKDSQRAILLGDNHSRFVIVSDLNHHVWHEDPIKEALPVCREQGLGNKPIMSGQAVTHHRDAVPIITANIKGVATQTSHNLYLNPLPGRGDKEPVVPLKSIHNHFLDPIECDVEPSPKDT